PPTLVSITPAFGGQGASVAVTLVGTNLTGAVVTPPVGVTSTGEVITPTSITSTFVIAATAPLVLKAVTVTTPGGIATIPFTINPPPPVLVSMTPNTGAAGAIIPVVIVGTNLTGS